MKCITFEFQYKVPKESKHKGNIILICLEAFTAREHFIEYYSYFGWLSSNFSDTNAVL
jgi:hypothetical protein